MHAYRLLLRSAAALVAAICLISAHCAARAASIYAPNGGAIRALIVGIDDYRPLRPLYGAVADAKDLDASLKAVGVPPSNIKTLLDWQATRKAIIAEMDRLVAEARAGDLAIIAFAGHGTRIKELHANTKPDHKDEAYVLAGYDPQSGAGKSELIAGPEMKRWIGLLDGKGVDVLFIADTCHGGGLVRKVEPNSNTVSFRNVDLAEEARLEAASVATALDATRSEASFPRLTFLAAADPLQKAPEVAIAGEKTPRGALSHAVARAIRGSALRFGASSLTRDELFKYARQRVMEQTNGRQSIFVKPTDEDRLYAEVFRTTPGTVVSAFQGATLDVRPIGLAVSNGDLELFSHVKSRISKFELTDNKQKADLVFVPERRVAISDGDVLAQDVDADDIPGVVDRIYAARALAKLAEDRSQSFRLLPDSGVHLEDEQVALQAEDAEGKFAIAFNITGTGVVQYLFPRTDESGFLRDGTWTSDIVVSPPFGSDLVVMIVSPKRLTDLEGDLAKLHNTVSAGVLPDILRAHLDPQREVRIGLATIVTAQREGSRP